MVKDYPCAAKAWCRSGFDRYGNVHGGPPTMKCKRCKGLTHSFCFGHVAAKICGGCCDGYDDNACKNGPIQQGKWKGPDKKSRFML